MKTNNIEFIFQKEDVYHFVRSIRVQNPIYTNIEIARTHGYQTIPLPPTMPMIVYKQIETPWILQPPVILRKQQCTNHQIMYIDQLYKGCVLLMDHFQRNDYTFIKQTLHLYDMKDNLCFEGQSHLIAGGVI